MSTSVLEAKRPAGWAAVPTSLLALPVSFLTLREHLTVWARVCRAWQAAASSPLSWPESLRLIVHKDRLPFQWQQERLVGAYGLRALRLVVSLHPSHESITCQELSAVLAGLAPSLLSLRIADVTGCPKLPRLETLDLTGYVNNSELAELLSRGRFPALTDLTVPSFLLNSVSAVFDHLPQTLKRLHLSDGQLPTANTVTRLVKCPQWSRAIPMLSISYTFNQREGADHLRALALMRQAGVRIPCVVWNMDSQLNYFPGEVPALLRSLRGLGIEQLIVTKQNGYGMRLCGADVVEALAELRTDGLRVLRGGSKLSLGDDARALFPDRKADAKRDAKGAATKTA